MAARKISTDFKSDAEWLADDGLDPEVYLLDAVTLNKWGTEDGDPAKCYTQTKLQARKKNPDVQIVPARIDGPRFKKPRTRQSYKKKSRLVVFASDFHCPYNDKHMTNLFLQWLAEHQPHEVILGGDILDFPLVSRHVPKPEYAASVQTCLDTGYVLIRQIREAVPKAHIRMIEGNHSIRLRSILLSLMPQMYGIAPGATSDEESQEALSLDRLLRLDELKVELVTDPESKSRYETAQIEITPGLLAIHGITATKQAGRSVTKTMEEMDGLSLIQGHSHRLSLAAKTVHAASGPRTIFGAEAGCFAELSLAKAYTQFPDWCNGFCTIDVHADGQFAIDLARYTEGSLFWRGQRLS